MLFFSFCQLLFLSRLIQVIGIENVNSNVSFFRNARDEKLIAINNIVRQDIWM